MGETKTVCDKCREIITFGYREDDEGNEGEVEIGHNDDCPIVQI